MKFSITKRLVVMFTLVVMATLMLTGAALYAVLDREQTRHQDVEVTGAFKIVAFWISRAGDAERWGRARDRLDVLIPASGSVRVWVLSDDPRFRYGSSLDPQRDGLHEDYPDGRGSATLRRTGETFRTQSRYIEALGDRPRVRLIVGLDEKPFQRTLRTFLVALVLVTLGAMGVVALLGRWIARVGLQPLQSLSQEAQALRPKTLSQRLRAHDLPVELSDLASAFNGALGRLEGAYKQLEAFNADVAHELRTPLANLIGGTQVALSRPRSAPELQEVLESNLEELDRLRSIINDMLFLARADQGEAATGLVTADVAQEIEKTIEFFQPVLDETGTSVAVRGDVAARSTMNIALFRRALSNLLQNGIEHAAPGGSLAVDIRREAGLVWIRVSNPGEPIGEAHLPHLFTRFYRVDAARRDTDGQHHGYGLGLAIVKAVAVMHGGQVSAVSGDGATTVGFSVPDGVPAESAA